MYVGAVFLEFRNWLQIKLLKQIVVLDFLRIDPGDTIEMDDMDIFTLPDLEQYNVRIMFTGKENFFKKNKE